MMLATPKTLVWILDNHDRENQILIKHARIHQDELRSLPSDRRQSLTPGLREGEKTISDYSFCSCRRFLVGYHDIIVRNDHAPTSGPNQQYFQQTHRRLLWFVHTFSRHFNPIAGPENMEKVEEEREKIYSSLRRICTFATGNKLFHKALQKFAIKVGFLIARV